MKQYFISYVLQEEGKQDIFGECCLTISGKLIFSKLKEVLKTEVESKIQNKLPNRKLIILNIVKL